MDVTGNECVGIARTDKLVQHCLNAPEGEPDFRCTLNGTGAQDVHELGKQLSVDVSTETRDLRGEDHSSLSMCTANLEGQKWK